MDARVTTVFAGVHLDEVAPLVFEPDDEFLVVPKASSAAISRRHVNAVAGPVVADVEPEVYRLAACGLYWGSDPHSYYVARGPVEVVDVGPMVFLFE